MAADNPTDDELIQLAAEVLLEVVCNHPVGDAAMTVVKTSLNYWVEAIATTTTIHLDWGKKGT